MEFITDFISNQAVILIAFVTVIAFIAKLIIGYVSKDKTVIIPASELIDEAKERIIDKIEDIEAEEKAKNLLNPVVKEGFNVIKQPSNPNRDSDNSEDSNSDDDEEEGFQVVPKVYEDGTIRGQNGEIVGRIESVRKPDTHKDIIERESK